MYESIQITSFGSGRTLSCMREALTAIDGPKENEVATAITLAMSAKMKATRENIVYSNIEVYFVKQLSGMYLHAAYERMEKV